MSARAAPETTPAYASEAALAERWSRGLPGPLRLADGRALRVVFPGVPGGGSGPDFRGAILDAGGDLLRGDVEIHLRASGWRTHGHHLDAAYGAVCLHVVAENDTGAASTLHAGGRAIAVLVLPPGQGAFPPPFTPPCAIRSARGTPPGAALARMSLRRLRMKAARIAPYAADAGPSQALYTLALEQLGGSANREAFARLARRLPLGVLLERADGALPGTGHAVAMAAELRGAAATLALQRAGLRPLARPGPRLEAAAELCARLWPRGVAPAWPGAFAAGLPCAKDLQVAGIGRSAAVELLVNAVLPVALAASLAPELAIEAAWRAAPSPGTYGRLRRLEAWLTTPDGRPFATAAELQGGLLLHADYCTKGMCGRCPLSE